MRTYDLRRACSWELGRLRVYKRRGSADVSCLFQHVAGPGRAFVPVGIWTLIMCASVSVFIRPLCDHVQNTRALHGLSIAVLWDHSARNLDPHRVRTVRIHPKLLHAPAEILPAMEVFMPLIWLAHLPMAAFLFSPSALLLIFIIPVI